MGEPRLCSELGSSEIFQYHCILLKANHPESSRELFRPRARSRDTHALLLGCLLAPASPERSQTWPGGRTGEPSAACGFAHPTPTRTWTGTLVGSRLHFPLPLRQDSDATAQPRRRGCVGPAPLSPPRLILAKTVQKRVRNKRDENTALAWHSERPPRACTSQPLC